MIVVDTSVWIEFFRGRNPCFSRLRELLEDGEVLAAECVFGELLQGAKGSDETEIITAYWKNLPKFSLDGMFIQAGILSARHKWLSRGIGLIDGSLIACARESSSGVWTLDKQLLSALREEERYNV